MHHPWDRAQPDEWLPQSLRLCWGGDGGDGGSGFSGDSGGWSGDSGGWGGDGGFGGATTGGGDWGSAGSADFSGSWAGGDTNAWAGTAYDASSFSTGTLGGGDWGSFGTASFPDSTPGAIFTDIAGPNPGVTTGGGDWGSAGTSSFAGTGGGPSGIFSADSGAGTGGGFYGSSTGGGLFGDYGTGGGFTGLGGTYGTGTGTGTFGGFGSAGTSSGGRSGGPLGASNTVSAAPSGGRAFADTVGGGTLTGQTSGRTSDAPTRGEAEVASAGPDVDSGRADADADADAAPAQSDFGKPATSEAAPEAEAGPSLSDAAPAGMIGGTQDAAPASAGQTAAPAQASQQSAFGPQSVNADYQGSPYASNYDQGAGPASFDSRFGDWGQQDAAPQYQDALQTLSDLTQSALSGYDYQGSPYANMGQPDSFEAPSDPGYQPDAREGPMGPLAEPGWFQSIISDIPGVTTPAWAQDFGKSIYDVGTWLSPLNQNPITFPSLDPRGWVDAQSPMGMPGHQAYAGPFAGPDVVGNRGAPDTFDSRFGFDTTPSEFAPGQPGMTTFEGGPMSTGFTTFEGGPMSTGHTNFEGEPVSSTGHTNFFDANPYADMLPAGDPSYPTSPDTAFSPGAYPQDEPGYYATDAQPEGQPSYDTTMESGPPGEQTTTDNAATRGSDPALSGYPADPGARPGTEGQPAEGQPGPPGTIPGAPPQAGGPSFVSEAAVSAVANAASNAALNVNAPPAAVDAAGTAAYNAALNLASPADQANAASAAALQAGATPAQAEAIASATYTAAMSQTAFTPGQPGQQQQGQPGPAQPGAPVGPQTQTQTQTTPPPPSLIEQAQPTAPGVPMPQARPADAPPGLVDMQTQTPGVPMPQARPTDAPSFTPPANAKNTAVGPNMEGVVPAHTKGGQTRTTAPVAIIVHRTESGPTYGISNLKNQMQEGGGGYSYSVGRDPNDPNKAVVYELRDPSKTAGHMKPNTSKAFQSSFRSHGQLSNKNTIGVSFIADTDEDITPAMKESMQALVEALGKNNNIPPSRVFGHGQVNPGHRQAGEGRNVVNWAQSKGGNWGTTQVAQPRPPAEVPADIPATVNLPPVAPPDPVVAPRPPADIPAPVAPLPAPFLAPPRAGRADPKWQAERANDILKDATKNLNKQSGEAEFQAASVVAAKALAAAGIPAAMARSLMAKGAYEGAAKNGFDINAFLIGPKIKSSIDATIDAAMQGYRPAAPGEVQGPSGFQPDAPSTPGKQGALPFGQQYAGLTQEVAPRAEPDYATMVTRGDYGREGDVAGREPVGSWNFPTLQQLSPLLTPPAPAPSWGRPSAPPPPQYTPGGPGMFNPFRGNEANLGGLLQLAAGGRDVGAPPAIEPGQLPGRAEWESSRPGLRTGEDPSVLIEGPQATPPAPPPAFQAPSINDRGIDPDTFMMRGMEREQNQQNLDPRSWQQASLLDILQNFNPISTAEARSGRSQAGNLQAPRADPGTIQGRLSSQRSNVINDLQTNQGLRNTLDLIVTGEVGSQGKAAVLGFLETAMNKVAAEASREGRSPTGRDLLNYLNNRSYFPDTWGKIESGKIKGGALTDDLLGAIAGGSNTTNLSTGNSSAKSEGSRFGGNPTNVTIGREHYGVESYGHHAAWYNAMGAPEAGRGIGSDFAAQPGMPAVVAVPPVSAPDTSLRGLAKGGHVDKDEPVVVGEEGPEFFIPDQPGTVVPHMPQGGGGDFGRWPKVPTPDYPGRYAGVGREMKRQMRAAQDPAPSLMDLVDSGRLRLTPNWRAMLNDPSLIALGRSRMDDRREGIDPGAEQYGAFIPAPGPAAEPPDPGSPMAQALGFGSIQRRPVQIGRQRY